MVAVRFLAVLACTLPAALASAAPVAAPDPRGLFLAVERIARLPAERRAAEVPALYRDLAPPVMSFMVEAVLSSQPIEDYVAYLERAARTMTPEEVADAIGSKHGPNILRVAARRRAMQVLSAHPEAVGKLIEEDLASDEERAVGRATVAIATLRRTDFTQRIAAMYLAGGRHAQAARHCIAFLADRAAVGPILKDGLASAEKLAGHAMMLSSLQAGGPAEAELVKLLGSDKPAWRRAAAWSVAECRDPALARHVPALLADAGDARTRTAGAAIAGRLPDEAFATVRDELVRRLDDEDLDVRLEAACALAAHKDRAAARALLGFWTMPDAPQAGHRVMQAVAELTGETFGYEPPWWGPAHAANRAAIVRFDAWIKAHP